MKTSCMIIEDLLPMYHDGICSEESAALIEEHLKECESCRQFLASLRVEIELQIEAPSDDLKPLEEIQQRISREKKLFNGICEATFEKNRLICSAELFQKVKVLHISCANLNNVDFFNKIIQLIG